MIATLKIKQVVQNRLRQYAQHKTFQRALTRAFAAFAQQYPEWAASHFDHHFLTQGAASPLIGSLKSTTWPPPADLANAWADQMTWFTREKRQKLVAELTPVASDFLRLLEAELCRAETVGKLASPAIVSRSPGSSQGTL